MIVAGLQLDTAWLDPLESFRRASRLAQGAVALGARLLVLPEMFATGFTMDARRAAAESPRVTEFLASLAHDNGVWVIAGLAVAAPDLPHNSCAVFAPDGRQVARYDKIHPFSPSGEHEHYRPGDALLTLDIEGLRVTPFVCYDLRFPEPFRIAARDTDLYVVIANWPAARASAWRCLLAARAIENQAYVLGVNRVGEGDGLAYAGDSALHDPLGQILCTASGAEAVVHGPVEAETVARARARFGFLNDRRPELYERLAARA